MAASGPGRIDTHHHVIPEVYRAAMARLGVDGSGEAPWPDWSLGRSLEVMDANGIAAAVVSIASPGAYFGDVAATRVLARACNEALAAMVADRPGRLGALALVPLPDVEAALEETAYALDTLGLDGIVLLTHVAGRYLGNAAFDPLMAELDRRGAVVFVHPVRPPLDGLARFDYPSGLMELVFDTSRAIANLLYNGTLARFPGIRFLMSHAGGAAPFLLYRYAKMDAMPDVRARNPDGVAACLSRMYYDVAQSAVPATLRALMDVADPARVVFGTDYPFARNPAKVVRETTEGVAAFSGFDDALRRRVERDNALDLFPRFAD